MDAQEEVNKKLLELIEQIPGCPTWSITHFVPDERKAGGRYVTSTGIVSKFSTVWKWLQMEDGTHIWFEDILEIRKEP